MEPMIVSLLPPILDGELRRPSYLQDTSSAIGAWKSEKCTRQHESHSTDSMIYNPSAVLSCQQQLNKTSLSNLYDNLETGHSFMQHVNPYSINLNYFNHVPVEQTVPVSTEQEQECYMVKSNTIQDGISPIFTSTAISESSDYVNWKSMEKPSELKFGEKNLDLNLPNSSISSYFSRSLDKIIPFHPTTLDQQNAVVDSPCWKGSASHDQFDVGNYLACVSVAKGFEVQNHLDQGQNIAISTQCAENLLSQEKQNGFTSLHGTPFSFVCPITCARPEVESSSSSSVKIQVCDVQDTDSLNMTQEQKEDARGQILADFGLKNCDMKPFNDILSSSQVYQTAAISGVGNSHLGLAYSSEENLCDYASASFARDHVMGAFVHGVDAHPNNSKVSESSGFSSEGNTQLLVKAIHTITEVLLSTVHDDINMLKEDDLKLLRLVIDNLEGLASADKKDFMGKSCHVSGVEASLSQVEFPNSEEYVKLKNSTGITKTIHDKDLKFSNYKPDDFALRGIGANYKRCMAKAIEEVSKENFSEPEDATQALLYKNLWIEAEVSLCTLKYELQFARMKLEMKRNMHQEANLEGSSDVVQKCSHPGKFTGQKSMDAFVLNLMAKHRGNCEMEAHEVDKGVANDVDASVMARFNILKGRFENSNPNILEENLKPQESINTWSCFEKEGTVHQKVNLGETSDTDQKIPQLVRLSDLEPVEIIDECDKSNLTSKHHEGSKMKVHEMNDSTHGVDDPVAARFKLLKDRMDNLNSGTIEEHHPTYVGFCLDNNGSIVHEGNNDKAHEVNHDKEHGVDDSVIDRFKILEGRIDNLDSNTMEEHPINAEYCLNSSKAIVCEGNSVKELEVNDSVITRFKILKERMGNLNSNFMEEHPMNAGYCLESDDTIVHEGNNDKAHGVDDSVIARFKILGRTDNLNSSTMGEHPTYLHCLDDGEMIVPQYFSVQETSNLKSLANANFGFSPLNHQPCNSGEVDCQNSVVECKSSVQHLAKEHIGEMEQLANFSDCIKSGSYSRNISAKPATSSCIADWHDTRISNGASSSILSDWEHILEDELK